MGKAKKQLSTGPELVLILILLVLVWAGGAEFYHSVEGLSVIDSIYFTSMTLTTVGYGDFAPQTELGKLFTSVYAFVGIGIFLGFAAALFQVIAGKIRQRRFHR